MICFILTILKGYYLPTVQLYESHIRPHPVGVSMVHFLLHLLLYKWLIQMRITSPLVLHYSIGFFNLFLFLIKHLMKLFCHKSLMRDYRFSNVSCMATAITNSQKTARVSQWLTSFYWYQEISDTKIKVYIFPITLF